MNDNIIIVSNSIVATLSDARVGVVSNNIHYNNWNSLLV